MKTKVVSLFMLAIGLGLLPEKAHAGVDPVVAGAVEAQTLVLQDSYDKRSKLQEKILLAETAVTGVMAQVHDVEKKMVDYLSNASAAVSNLYEIKEIVDLVSTDIPEQIGNIKQITSTRWKGTLMASIGSKRIQDAYTEAMTLSPLVATLVTSSTWGEDKKKVNLLNAAERYEILGRIHHSLQSIRDNLWMYYWQCRVWSFQSLWRELDYESWAAMINTKSIAEYNIRRWQQTKW